ncbi:MAG TPA: tetratricopeptide repeat protein, partial [Spirochaetes bacterium]|nr:tetratricopeptide repeat protein [Spirochaetota bacterium]
MKRFTIVFLIMFVMGFILIHQNGSANSLSPLKQGMNLYKQGKYELSLVFLEKAFKENPLNYRLYFYLGNVYNHKKMFKKSIEAYKRGIEISPVQQKKEFLYNLARSYQGDKQYKEALGLYSKLEKESSKYPEIHLYRGMIYYNLQNKSAVIKSWETYLAQAPNGPQYQSIRKAIDIIKDDKFRWPVEVAK